MGKVMSIGRAYDFARMYKAELSTMLGIDLSEGAVYCLALRVANLIDGKPYTENFGAIQPCCEQCGTDKDVDYVTDPYLEEIKGLKEYRYLCGACVKAIASDI